MSRKVLSPGFSGFPTEGLVQYAFLSEPVSSLHFPAFGQERVFGHKVGKLNGRKWQKYAVLEEKFPTRGCREIIRLLQGIPQKKQGTGPDAKKVGATSNVGRRERRDDASDALQ